jgi:hypothetical protein
MLIVQQIKGGSQCLDRILNSYHKECVDIIESFSIDLIPTEENERSNALAQQALGYNVIKGMFSTKERPVLSSMCVCDGKSASEGSMQ